MAVSETWLHHKVGDTLINVPAYAVKRLDRSIRNPRGNLKIGGGVCVFYNTHFQNTLNEDMSQSDQDFKLLSISMKSAGYKKNQCVNNFIGHRLAVFLELLIP